LSKFYRLVADTDVLDYVRPSPELYAEPCGDMTLAEAVREGKVQFIDPSPLTVGLSDDGGLEFPDLLMYEEVPLLSSKFIECLSKLKVYLPFRKPITIKDDFLGYMEKYVLVVPPRVCKLSESGRYGIFILFQSGNLIATEDVKEAIESVGLENVFLEELEGDDL
jgi:hypothetical protein